MFIHPFIWQTIVLFNGYLFNFYCMQGTEMSHLGICTVLRTSLEIQECPSCHHHREAISLPLTMTRGLAHVSEVGAFMLSYSVVVTLCDPMNYISPDSSVHGISQARMLEWVAISFSRGSSWPRDQTHISCVSCIGRQILLLPCHQRSQGRSMGAGKCSRPWWFSLLLSLSSYEHASRVVYIHKAQY